MEDLLKRIAESDSKGVSAFLKTARHRGDQAWNIRLSLFPVNYFSAGMIDRASAVGAAPVVRGAS